MTGTLGRDRDAGAAVLPWLAHPVTVLALVALVVNDHVLKSAWPGVLTGKLSDVAGLVMAPPLLAVLIALVVPVLSGRVLAALAVALTGAGFVAVKALPPAAAAASSAWSIAGGPSLVRADATDLLALPALAIAWYAWRRVAGRPVRNRAAQVIRAALLIPAALLATAASDVFPLDHPETVWVGQLDDELVAGDGYYDPATGPEVLAAPAYFVATADGARHFHAWVPSSSAPAATSDRPDLPPVPAYLPPAQTQECIGNECFRVVPGSLGVQESTDIGRTWRTVWSVGGTRYAKLAKLYPDLGDPNVHLVSMSLAMTQQADGYSVLVANGRDGLLRRDTAGNWTRLGNYVGDGRFDSVPPLPAADPVVSLPVKLATGGLGLVAFAAGAFAATIGAARRGHPRQSAVPVAAGAALVAGYIALLAGGAATASTAVALAAVALVASVIGLVRLASWRALGWWAVFALAADALMGGATAIIVTYAWRTADRDFTASARLYAGGTVVVATLAIAALSGLLTRDRAGYTRPPRTKQPAGASSVDWPT